MNKKGQAQFIYAFMLAILLFVLGTSLATPLHEVITGKNVMNSTQLNCYNSTVDNQTKGVCNQVDSFQPIYIGLIFGLAGIVIGYKLGL